MNKFFTLAQAADYIQVSTRTLHRWAANQTGPARIKAGRQIRYRVDAIDEWMAAQEVTNAE